MLFFVVAFMNEKYQFKKIFRYTEKLLKSAFTWMVPLNILICNYNIYNAWTHVIQNIIKLHTLMFRIKEIQC